MQQLQRFIAVTDPQRMMTAFAQEQRSHPARQRIIIDNQNMRHGLSPRSLGRER